MDIEFEYDFYPPPEVCNTCSKQPPKYSIVNKRLDLIVYDVCKECYDQVKDFLEPWAFAEELVLN